MHFKEIETRIQLATQEIGRQMSGVLPKVAVILGSGFAPWSQNRQKWSLPYGKIPGFPETTVLGHEGNLILAEIGDNPVLVMQGRFHYYEGHPMAVLSIPVRVFKNLGIQKLVLTNASGGINPSFRPGDVMFIEDHINLVQNNPLIGPNLDQYGPRFPDASEVYSKRFKRIAFELAEELSFSLRKGVYAFVSGPVFETPAEIRMMAGIGADAVGMSTVPEAISARHAGIEVAGFSLIANLASGLGSQPLTHEDILATMEKGAPRVFRFLDLFIEQICHA